MPKDVRERFLAHLRSGLTIPIAAGISGISASCAYLWLAEDGFGERAQIAIEAGRAKILARIRKAGRDPKHWLANAWILERTSPQQFARIDRVVIEKAREEYARTITERLMALPPEIARAALTAVAGKTNRDEEDEPA